jgi:nitroimidazol reductase NimA-like FMN-containing flavoprotein (pyridoxamine 5'-phosphate oxidase superfamily)
MTPPESHLDLLERPLFAHLATVREDGAPVNPMWFLWDPANEVIKLTHTKKRHNFRYVQAEPRIALSITDPDKTVAASRATSMKRPDHSRRRWLIPTFTTLGR